MLLLPMAILTMADEDDRAYMTRLYREYRALMLKTAWEYSKDNETVEEPGEIKGDGESGAPCVYRGHGAE